MKRIKHKIKSIIGLLPNKVWTVIISVLLLSVAVGFGVWFVLKENERKTMLKEHFIEATTSTELSNKLLNQKEENYFVLGYSGNSADESLIRELKEVAKNNENIGWYAIDLNVYQGLLGSNSISPTNGQIFTYLSALNNEAQYWFVTSNYEKDGQGNYVYETDESGNQNKKFVDKSFKLYQTGFYNSSQLAIEINWVEENGAPYNEIGNVEQVPNEMSLQWTSVDVKTDETTNKKYVEVVIKATSLIKNDKENQSTAMFDYSKVVLKSKGKAIALEGDPEVKSLDSDSVTTITLRFVHNTKDWDLNNLELLYNYTDDKSLNWKIFRPAL